MPLLQTVRVYPEPAKGAEVTLRLLDSLAARAGVHVTLKWVYPWATCNGNFLVAECQNPLKPGRQAQNTSLKWL